MQIAASKNKWKPTLAVVVCDKTSSSIAHGYSTLHQVGWGKGVVSCDSKRGVTWYESALVMACFCGPFLASATHYSCKCFNIFAIHFFYFTMHVSSRLIVLFPLFLFSSLPPFISSWVALVFRQDQSLAQHTLNATNAMLAHAVQGSQMHRMIFVRTRMTHGWTSLFAYVPSQLAVWDVGFVIPDLANRSPLGALYSFDFLLSGRVRRKIHAQYLFSISG